MNNEGKALMKKVSEIKDNDKPYILVQNYLESYEK